MTSKSNDKAGCRQDKNRQSGSGIAQHAERSLPSNAPRQQDLKTDPVLRSMFPPLPHQHRRWNRSDRRQDRKTRGRQGNATHRYNARCQRLLFRVFEDVTARLAHAGDDDTVWRKNTLTRQRPQEYDVVQTFQRESQNGRQSLHHTLCICRVRPADIRESDTSHA